MSRFDLTTGCYAKLKNRLAVMRLQIKKRSLPTGDLIETEQIDCGFEMPPCYLYATGDTTALEAEYKAAASLVSCVYGNPELNCPSCNRGSPI